MNGGELTGKTTDDSSHDEMSDVLSATLEDGSHDPNNTGDLKDSTTAHVIT